MQNLFEKNLEALEKINPELVDILKNITPNKQYEVFLGNTTTAINIQDKQRDVFLYDSPTEEIFKQRLIYKKYQNYEYLFMYGIGNGILLKELLQEEKISTILLIEPELELLFIAFNLIDFSKEILDGKIIFLYTNQLNFQTLLLILNGGRWKFYARVYELLIMAPYYEKNYIDDIYQINNLLTDAYAYITTITGNDITDQLVGLKHTIQNFPTMLKNPTFHTLKQSKNTSVAVIVSTGPSLYKQLDLLKQYAPYVTIISVDASLPILEKHGIKPDIVTSIERVPLTATFFENTSEEFQKDIVFLSASLQHKKVLKAIKGEKVLVLRPFEYNMYLKFDDYGYIGHGLSAANLAYELALSMKFDTCIFIGQDLAYGKDGKSHAKGHVLGDDEVKTKEDDVELLAYGENGTVKSTRVWNLFKKGLEEIILSLAHTNIKTYNCTEGGAKIEGTIEKPFKYVLQETTKTSSPKQKISLPLPSEKEINQNTMLAKQKLEKIIEEGEKLQKEINPIFLSIENFAKKYENKDLKTILKLTKDHKIIKKLDEIEKIRNILESNLTYKNFFHDIIRSYILAYELELTTIKVKEISTPKENKEKALQWILSHRYWLFSITGILHNIVEIIKEELKEWS